MTEEERKRWLAVRRTGVGASEVATVTGVGAFKDKTPFGLYLEKLELVPPWAGNADTRMGAMLEDVVAQLYAEREGVEVESLPPGTVERSPRLDYCLATPDRKVKGRRKRVECKTASTGEGWGPDGSEVVPPGYWQQCQWQLMAAEGEGVESVDLAVLIALSDFRVYTIVPSPAAQDTLQLIVGEFWGRVQRRDPPPIDFRHPEAAKLLHLCFRPQPGKEAEWGEDEGELLDAYERAKESAKKAEAGRDELKARLVAACGDAEYGVLPDGRVLHRKTVVIPEKFIEAHTQPQSQQVRLYVKQRKVN